MRCNGEVNSAGSTRDRPGGLPPSGATYRRSPWPDPATIASPPRPASTPGRPPTNMPWMPGSEACSTQTCCASAATSTTNTWPSAPPTCAAWSSSWSWMAANCRAP
ncbi:hypothetical protein G6F50_017612 [Rhizopus delemar]|uniref:Uncharacterized protein n=1 Tax=Rhizopus delemar TaxID=936053 RepID=A0A9P7C018_9FUNG|nr:hypothetical protein G6F50_017612 [Rhizopus delemar]